MTAPLWLQKAWAWTKANWKWLLLPVGVLLYVAGRLGKKDVVVQSSVLEGHEEAAREINAEAAEKVRIADEKEAAQLAGIDANHSAAVTSGTQKHVNAAAEAQGDSEKVNDLLVNVGKDMRK